MTQTIQNQINEILLRRQGKIIFFTEIAEGHDNQEFVATILSNLNTYGYTVTSRLLKALTLTSREDLVQIYNMLAPAIKTMLGADKNYRPLYADFPDTHMNMLDADNLFKSLILGEGDVVIRQGYQGVNELKVIDMTDIKGFYNIFVNIMNSKTSISPTDKEDLTWFFNTMDADQTIRPLIPESIPLKENVALINALLVKNGEEPILHHFWTATDILRFAVALSDGDISLADDTPFIKMSRKHRRLIMGLLNLINNPLEDMARYQEKWKRLGEKVHPGEAIYAKKYTKAVEAFKTIRSGEKIETFNSLVAATEMKVENGVIDILMSRPGEFARRLDHLLRTNPEHVRTILTEFSLVAPQASVTVLLQVMNHFVNRATPSKWRAFPIKGTVSKLMIEPNTVKELDPQIALAAAYICRALIVSVLSERPSLGKVYIDPKLDEYMVPFGQRSASKMLKTITRGSSVTVSENRDTTVRGFIYWKQSEHEIVDIDLSVGIYDTGWNTLGHVSFNKLTSDYGITHSGDIRSAPVGASEFVDIDTASVRDKGGRYIVFSILSYSHQKFIELPECFFGWMERDNADLGEVYEPITVVNRSDITTDAENVVACILDVETMKIIWTDTTMDSISCSNVIEGLSTEIRALGEVYTNIQKPSLGTLFQLHADARATMIVDTPEEADTVFSADQGGHNYDFNVISAEYL